jgi:hypothetical protein
MSISSATAGKRRFDRSITGKPVRSEEGAAKR